MSAKLMRLPKSPEEVVLDAIEKASKGPNGGDSGRVLVDEYILRRFVNKSELEYERDSMKTFIGRFRRGEEVAENEWVEYVCGEECLCGVSETCVRCCTQLDMVAMPFLANQVIGTREQGSIKEFFVLFEPNQLEFAGFFE